MKTRPPHPNDDLTLTEEYALYDAFKKERRLENKENGTTLLNNKQIKFESKNGGLHLIVQGPKGLIDFWPSTNRWAERNGKKGHGVDNLIRLVGTTSVPTN